MKRYLRKRLSSLSRAYPQVSFFTLQANAASWVSQAELAKRPHSQSTEMWGVVSLCCLKHLITFNFLFVFLWWREGSSMQWWISEIMILDILSTINSLRSGNNIHYFFYVFFLWVTNWLILLKVQLSQRTFSEM